MRIVISTLLFTILVFLSFYGLNAADNPESSSRSNKRARNVGGRPRGSRTRRLEGVPKGEFHIKHSLGKPVVVTGPPSRVFEYMGKNIEVWLDNSGARIIKADYPGNAYPTGSDYRSKNFLVHLVTLSGTLQLVEYINQDGTLMGVKAPKPTCANVMEPDDTQWFIVYHGKYFRVRLNPETKAVESITLASEDENKTPRGHRAEEVDMAGFKFVVLTEGMDGKVTGAAHVGK